MKYGNTTNQSHVYQGMEYNEVNTKIIDYLKSSNFLYSTEKIKIKVQVCNECKKDIIYRPINDWYIVKKDEEEISEEIIDKFESIGVKYKKEDLKNQVQAINNKREALISDKNILGTPIPVFYCAECGANIISEKSINILSNMIKAKGSDTWYKQTPEEILGGQVACMKCGCTFFFKENATLNNFFKYVCINLMQKDILLKERLTTNILIESKKEFFENLLAISFTGDSKQSINDLNKILIHSAVKDKVKPKNENNKTNEKNDKIEKEIKKVKRKNKNRNTDIKIESDITRVVGKYGTDVLRLWAAMFCKKNRIYLNSLNIVNVNKKYKNIRKTFKFMLSNLYDFNPTKNYVEVEKRNEIDKYIYNEFAIMEQKVKEAYSNLDFDEICSLLSEFGENQLCKKYFDSIKYKLYILGTNDIKRRSVQSNMYDIILVLAMLWFPIIPFTLEEIWQYIYHKTPEEEKNIFSYKYDIKPILAENDSLILKWQRIFTIKEKFDLKVRAAQAMKKVKGSLEVGIVLNTNEYTKNFIEQNYEDILECVNVSNIKANVSKDHDVKIVKETSEKCARCGHYTIEIGKNLKYRYLCPKCAEILDKEE